MRLASTPPSAPCYATMAKRAALRFSASMLALGWILPGAGRAGEPERAQAGSWVPALAFTSGMLGQNAEGSVRSDSTISYSYFAQDTGLVVSHTRPGPRVPFPGKDPILVPLTTIVTRSLAEGKTEQFTFR